MHFDKFQQLVPLIENASLLASEAHVQMAPKDRIKYYKNFDYSNLNARKSAVLSLFYPKDGNAHILLIVRSEYQGVHSAQISFPGGKMEPTDVSLQQTALRETFEEVGVSANDIQISKQWSDIYIPPSNFLVSPFMGITSENLNFNIDRREVHRVLELPLSNLLDNQIVTNVSLSTSYAKDIEVPAFLVEDYVVWGATAMILNEIKQIIKNVL